MSQGWIVDPVADTITFQEPPPAGTDNITIDEYASGTFNATAVFRLGAWSDAYGFPGEIEFYADRLWFAATVTQPQTAWGSRIGDYSYFGRSTPILDDDAITATLNARQLNKIVDLVPKQHLLALTTGGVWKIGGGDSEVVTPSTVAARPQPSAGASRLPALDVGETAVYVTQKGGEVRDLAFTFEADGYAGSDLTAFASHLLKNRQILDWDYQSVPYSAVYAVRDDGLLLTMTYKREHQVVAWARQETQGVFESVACIPEDGINAVYVVVRRLVDGVWRRYVERFAEPTEDRRDWVGVDCALSYDGRNTTATTLTLTSGTGDWLDPVTVTASASAFTESNVGDAVVLDYAGEPLRLDIVEYIAPTQVRASPSYSVPLALRTPGTDWALAVDTLAGLEHLEGRTVSVAADGHDYAPQVVDGAQVSISPPAVVVHVGLGFVSEFQSLDLSIAGAEPIGTRNKLVRQIGVLVQQAASMQAGTSFDHMEELKPRDDEAMTLPAEAKSTWALFDVHGEWQQNPRLCLRVDSAYPASILAVEADPVIGG